MQICYDQLNPECKEMKEIENLSCMICFEIANEPVQCKGCKKVFCTSCIYDWKKEQNVCIQKCSPKLELQPLEEELKLIYENLEFQCNVNCKKYIKFKNLQEHQNNCGIDINFNHDCQGLRFEYKNVLCCSLQCYQNLTNNYEDQFQSYFPVLFLDQQFFKVDNNIINYENNNREFNTIVSSVKIKFGFTNIKVKFYDASHVKIGFTSKKQFEQGESFSDFEDGFAFYNKGQLRENSKFHGLPYGIQIYNNKPCNFEIQCSINKSFGQIQYTHLKMKRLKKNQCILQQAVH